MHDVRSLLDDADAATAALARRRYALDVQPLRTLVARRAELTRQADALRTEANRISNDVRGERDPAVVDRLRAAARDVKARLQDVDVLRQQVNAELETALLPIPNLPGESTPDGAADSDAVEVGRWGGPPEFDFAPRDHAEIGQSLGILDLTRAAKLSGARFAVTSGAGAALERAIVAYCLDRAAEHGYTEYGLPYLVNRATMTGTGQLPKFEDDLFRTSVGERELFLVPTAEVPLVNLFAGETLPAKDLPLAVTALTQCFRSEAGSYGRDTKGILRLHQFAKVELVRICDPAQAAVELALLVEHAQACLRGLGLAHRTVQLPAGDLGFSARCTYDVEVWLPSQQTYREISSCSDCGEFQARRAKIKMQGRGGKALVATLNGSALPVGRTMAAILEQHQQADGSVTMPAALVPYLGFDRIEPARRGKPVATAREG